jgi:hypothetical protein
MFGSAPQGAASKARRPLQKKKRPALAYIFEWLQQHPASWQHH